MRTKKNKKILEWATEQEILQGIPKDFNSSEKKYEDYIWHGIPENPDYFDDVVRLNLSHCELFSLPDDFFENFIFLRELDLSNNQLYYLPEGIFPNLEILNLKNNEAPILLPDSFDTFEELKSLEVLHAGAYGKALRCSQELNKWLLSRNLGLTEEDIGIKRTPEPFIVNNKTYLVDEHIITIMVESVDVINEDILVPEMKFSDLDNDRETALEIKGYLEGGRISQFNEETNSIQQLEPDVEILMRPFSYNLSMNLELAEGRIGPVERNVFISIYVSKDIIQAIIEEYDRGETRMTVSILCNVYAEKSQYDAMTEYERDIVLTISHRATLAKYVTRRILMKKEDFTEEPCKH